MIEIVLKCFGLFGDKNCHFLIRKTCTFKRSKSVNVPKPFYFVSDDSIEELIDAIRIVESKSVRPNMPPTSFSCTSGSSSAWCNTKQPDLLATAMTTSGLPIVPPPSAVANQLQDLTEQQKYLKLGDKQGHVFNLLPVFDGNVLIFAAQGSAVAVLEEDRVVLHKK